MREKRQLERFLLEILAAIECLISDRERRLLNLLTRNICSGGAYFHTTQLLPEGTKVKIDLVLPLDRLKTLNDECRQAYIRVLGPFYSLNQRAWPSALMKTTKLSGQLTGGSEGDK